MSRAEDDLKAPELTREERGRLYELLRANAPARLKRIEYMLIALLASTGARIFGGLPVDQPAAALIQLIFG